MGKTEDKLRVLAVVYGRYPVERDGQHGFESREHTRGPLFDTLEEAIAAEAFQVRQIMIDEQEIIKSFESSINERLVHLGILEM